MAEYSVDGLFFTQNLTGIQRYAFEILDELDKIVKRDFIEIVVPESVKIAVKYRNISIVKYGKLNGIPWRQTDFAYYLKKNKRKAVCLTNDIPLIYPHGIAVIHDISYKVNPHFFKGIRDKMSALYHKINYRVICNSKMKIVTVSEFSKSEIIRCYNVTPERITVCYNSWQHTDKVDYSKDIFLRYPELKDREYYFSLCTLAYNKNLKWILNCAKKNPEKLFVIAGGGKIKNFAENCDIPNVLFTGYVSDEDAKTLMKNCKAFIFPTLYEGFGIPPLEAVASGTRNIYISDTPCLREIYGEYAKYIDLADTDYIIPEFKSVDYTGLLNKYSWKKSAEKLLNILTAER